MDALDPQQLSPRAIEVIDKADQMNKLVISDISIWEIAMLIKKGRIEVETTASDFMNLFLASRNLSVQNISPEIAELSVNFGSEINNDPADRIIAATSIVHSAKLITADQNLRNCNLLNTFW